MWRNSKENWYSDVITEPSKCITKCIKNICLNFAEHAWLGFFWQDIEVNIKEIDDVMIGTDFNVKITVKNISESKETRHISKMPVDIYAMTYTGTIKGLVKKQSFLDIALDHGEG